MATFRVYPTASGRFNVTWTCPKTGRTRHASCSTHDKGEAQDRALAVIAGKSIIQARANFTIGDLIGAYSDWRLDAKGESQSFATNFAPVLAFWGGMRPDQISDPTIAKYRAHRRSMTCGGAAKTVRTVSDNSAVRELKQLRAAVKWGQRNPGWKDGLSGVVVTLPDVQVNAIDRALTRAEVGRLLAVLADKPHLDLFVRLAIATAGRMSAILSREWAHVTWPADLVAGDGEPGDNMMLTSAGVVAPIGAMSSPIRIDMGKDVGSKRRPLGYISRDNVKLWARLVSARASADPACPFIIQYGGKGISEVTLDGAFERAGIANIKRPIHVLKHTACTLMLLDGVPPHEVAEHAGTSVDIILAHYKNYLPDKIAERGRALAF